MPSDQHERSAPQYTDVREFHPDFDHRECPCCGTEWYYKLGSSRGTHCPHCRSKPLFRRLAEEYAEHYYEAQQADDSNIKPPDYHHAIPTAMAYEASEILGYGVNHFHCMHYIWCALPDGARHARDEEPQTKVTRLPDRIISGPTEGSA